MEDGLKALSCVPAFAIFALAEVTPFGLRVPGLAREIVLRIGPAMVHSLAVGSAFKGRPFFRTDLRGLGLRASALRAAFVASFGVLVAPTDAIRGECARMEARNELRRVA